MREESLRVARYSETLSFKQRLKSPPGGSHRATKPRVNRTETGLQGKPAHLYTVGKQLYPLHVPTTLIYVVSATFPVHGRTPYARGPVSFVSVVRPFLALRPDGDAAAFRIIWASGNALLRSAYINDRWGPKEETRAQGAGERDPRKPPPRDNGQDIKTCVKLSHLWGTTVAGHGSLNARHAITFYLSAT